MCIYVYVICIYIYVFVYVFYNSSILTSKSIYFDGFCNLTVLGIAIQY